MGMRTAGARTTTRTACRVAFAALGIATLASCSAPVRDASVSPRAVEPTSTTRQPSPAPQFSRGSQVAGLTASVPTDASGGGSIGGGRLTVGLSVSTDGHTFTPAHHSSVQGPYFYRSYQFIPGSTFVAGSCALPTPPGIGIVLLVEMYERATGALIDVSARCVPAVQPGAPIVIPDAPPTIGEIWDAVTLPPPTVNLSPEAEGVTGLDTWMWSASPQTINVNVAIGPWRVTGTATRNEFLFDAGEGDVTATDTSGSRQQPSVTHTFEVKGTYDVAVGTTWTANVSMSGPGLTARPTPIGTARLGAEQPYRVVEIRSVLTG